MAEKKKHSKTKTKSTAPTKWVSSVGLRTTERQVVEKKTTIGHSRNTRLKSKNDRRLFKLYRGQGG